MSALILLYVTRIIFDRLAQPFGPLALPIGTLGFGGHRDPAGNEHAGRFDQQICLAWIKLDTAAVADTIKFDGVGFLRGTGAAAISAADAAANILENG